MGPGRRRGRHRHGDSAASAAGSPPAARGSVSASGRAGSRVSGPRPQPGRTEPAPAAGRAGPRPRVRLPVGYRGPCRGTGRLSRFKSPPGPGTPDPGTLTDSARLSPCQGSHVTHGKARPVRRSTVLSGGVLRLTQSRQVHSRAGPGRHSLSARSRRPPPPPARAGTGPPGRAAAGPSRWCHRAQAGTDPALSR